MTNLQEDLTGAFERRASAAIVEDNLDAILSGTTTVVRFSSHDRSSRQGGALLAVAASAAVLVGAAGLVWATTARTATPASSSAPKGPANTASKPAADSSPSSTPVTITTAIPGSPTSATLLPPEVVTFSNYEAGILAFADCLAAAGHPLLQLHLRDDEPRLYFYELTNEGDATSCYDDHLAVIDEAWQIKLQHE